MTDNKCFNLAESITWFIKMALGSRVKALREKRRFSQAQLAEMVGVSQTAIHLLEQRDSRSSKFLVELANALYVTPEWLVTGIENPKSQYEVTQENNELKTTTEKIDIELRRIPVIGEAELGEDRHYQQDELGIKQGLVLFPCHDSQAYSLRCVGQSMFPRYRSGEYVIISPAAVVEAGDEVYVKTKSGKAMVKILSYIRDGYAYLDSFKEDYKQIVIALDDIAQMHSVIGSVNKVLHRTS